MSLKWRLYKRKQNKKRGNISLHLFLAREAQPNSPLPLLHLPRARSSFPAGQLLPSRRASPPWLTNRARATESLLARTRLSATLVPFHLLPRVVPEQDTGLTPPIPSVRDFLPKIDCRAPIKDRDSLRADLVALAPLLAVV